MAARSVPLGATFDLDLTTGLGFSFFFAWPDIQVSAGALPPGLTVEIQPPGGYPIDSRPHVVGVATKLGTYAATVSGTHGTPPVAYAFADTWDCVLPAGCALITIGPDSLKNGRTNHPYHSAHLTASGGTAPYTWSLFAGSLPAGMTLSSGGLLSGTPTLDGEYVFTVKVADVGGCPQFIDYTLTILEDSPLQIRVTPGVSIHGAADDAANEASFSASDPEPTLAGQYALLDPLDDRVLHAGSAVIVTRGFDLLLEHTRWDVRMTDWRWLFNRRRPFGVFADDTDPTNPGISATDIVLALLESFTSGFTGAHVQTGLPKVTIAFDGSQSMTEALTAIGAAIGCHWHLDTDKDLHFYFVPAPPIPGADVGPAPGPATAITLTEAGSLTRPPLSGLLWVRYAFKYADGTVSDYSPISNVLRLTGTGDLQLDDILTGDPSPVTGAACVGRLIYASGNQRASYSGTEPTGFINGLVDVLDNVATSLTLTSGVPDGLTTFSPFGFGHGTAALNHNFPFLKWQNGRAVPQPTPRPAGPGTALTVAQSTTLVAPSPLPAYAYFGAPMQVQFAESFVYADDVESALGPVSATITLDGTHALDFSGAVTGAALAGVPVRYRKLYASFAPSGTPTWRPGTVIGFWIIPENTSTTGTTAVTTSIDEFRFLNVAATEPTGGLGPNPEADDAPDPIDGDTPLLYDPPLTVTMDVTQIRNRIFVRGPGSTLAEAAFAGGLGLRVLDATPFDLKGGSLYVAGQVLRYLYPVADVLVLAEALLDDVPIGQGVNTWAQRDDAESQAWLAGLEGYGSDGIHEGPVVDANDLVTTAELEARAEAELLIGAPPIITVQYGCRDAKSVAGAMVAFSMSVPAIAQTLRIQDVAIDQIGQFPDLHPRYTVTASSRRYVLADIIRTGLARSAGGGGGSFVSRTIASGPGGGRGSIPGYAATAGRLAVARSINGVAFDGSADITVNPVAASIHDAMVVDVAWAKVTGRPTTLAGYGITDAPVYTEPLVGAIGAADPEIIFGVGDDGVVDVVMGAK